MPRDAEISKTRKRQSQVDPKARPGLCKPWQQATQLLQTESSRTANDTQSIALLVAPRFLMMDAKCEWHE
jgi:hypothetical protein